jgi:hypothetical protein
MERGRPERPLDDASGPVRDLASSLRGLRAAAGNPSYRTMAATAHFSPATLARAAAGHRLPSLEVVVAYAAACGGDREEWEQRWRDCAENVARARAESRAVSALPDPGADSVQLPQPGQPPAQDRVLARRRWRTRRSMTALAAFTLAAAAALLWIGATPDAPGQQGPANAPATVITMDPNAPKTQQLGKACNPDGLVADISGAPAPSPHPIVRMSWETPDQIARWGPWWPVRAPVVRNLTASQAYDGKQSLQVRVTGPFVAIGTNHIAGLTPGATVTVYIWYGGQGSGYICPFGEDKSSTNYWIPQEPLQLKPSDRRGWYKYSWPMPTTFLPKGTGFQLSKTSRSDFVILLDAVSW